MIMGSNRLEEFLRRSAGLDIDKSDMERLVDLKGRQLNDLLVIAVRNASSNNRDIIHERFKQFSDAELKQLRLLPVGSRLEQGATYSDLNNLDLGEFTATSDMRVGRNNWLVATKDVPYELWNRLLGLETAERLRTTE